MKGEDPHRPGQRILDGERHRRADRQRQPDHRKGEPDEQQIQLQRSVERSKAQFFEPKPLDRWTVDHSHHHAGDEDEALRRRDDIAVVSGDHIEPRRAAEVIDDHHEDAIPANEIQPQVAPAFRLVAHPAEHAAPCCC